MTPKSLPLPFLEALGKTYVLEVAPELIFLSILQSNGIEGLSFMFVCSINLELLLFELVSI